MKVIKSDSGFLAYQNLFKQLLDNNSKIVVWQLSLDSGERLISDSRLNSFQSESGLIHLELPQGSPIVPQLPVYFYSEDLQFIFKTNIQIIKGNVFSLYFPTEIQMLEEEDAKVISEKVGVGISTFWKSNRLNFGEDRIRDFMIAKPTSKRSAPDQEFLNNEFEKVSLDEEEKLFLDKRESPRTRPKIDKWVKVLVEGSDEVKLVRLFDLSRGGMGFITLEVELFPKGNELQVVGFEEFDLDDPLVGKIMSNRAIDESLLEYKIGVKFNEGQD